MFNKNNAFSILEMSIILSIIALLSSAVVVGKRLIDTAKVKNFISLVNATNSAVSNFVSVYDNYPGDFKRASEYFGSTACQDHATHSELTCNGDGNRKIGSNNTSDGKQGEASYAFLHMQLAKLYTDDTDFVPHSISDSDNFFTADWQNSPFYKIDGIKGRLVFAGISNFSGKTAPYSLFYGAVVESGATQGLATNSGLSGITSWSIDQKIDDGILSTGNTVFVDGEDATSGDCVKTEQQTKCYMKHVTLNN